MHDVIITEDILNKSSNALKKDKNNKLDINISNLSEVQISLIDIRKNENVLGVKMENILNTSIEEKERSPNNKENQTLNIVSPTSTEKSVQPINTLSLLSTDSLTSTININKTLNEKENKSILLNKVSLDKQLDSRSSIEAAMNHSALFQDSDSTEEKMNISTNSLSSTDNQNNLDTSLRSDANKKQSSHHDVDSKSSIDNTNKLILVKNDTIELLDKSSVAKKTSIENKSESFEDIIEEALNKSDKNKDSKKSIITEISEMSNLSINHIPNKRDSIKSLIFIQTLDNNTKILEERNPCPGKNEISSIVDRSIANHSRQLSNDAEILPLNDKSSDDDQSVMQSSVSRDDVTNNSFKEKQKTLSEQTDYFYVVPEIITSSFKTSNADNVLQDTQSPSIPKTSEKSITEIAEDNSDLDIGIELFQDIPAQKTENDKVELSSQLTEKLETRNSERLETQNCDFVLVDKQAWFEAKNIEETKAQELLEYDSDTILSKSQLETAKTSFSDVKRLSISNQKTDLDNEKIKIVKFNKKRKLFTKRRSASQRCKNSSSECEEEENSSSIANKSSEQLETAAVTQCNTLKLTKSEQANTTEQIFQMHDISDKEIEDNTDRSRRSLSADKKTTFLRKSTEKRKSLNKFMKDTSSKQSNMQDLYVNQPQIDTSEEDFDNADAHIKKKRSLNKSNKIDNNIITACNNIIIEDRTISLSKDNIEEDESILTNCLMNKKSKSPKYINKILTDSNDEISNNVNIIRTIDLRFKNKSPLAKLSSNTDLSDNNESAIPQFLFVQSSEDDNKNDGVNDSIDPDIKKEYNLSGIKQKLPDDDVPADECRDSEVEFSDPDDHGSDLIDFIVDDDDDEYIENEKNEENNDVKDLEEDKIDIESEKQYISTLTSSFEQKKELDSQCSMKNKAEQTLTKLINTSAIESKEFITSSAILDCTPKLNLQNNKSQTVVSELQSDNSSNVEIKKRVTQDMRTNNQTMKKNLKKNYIKLNKIDKSIQNTLSKKKKSITISERDINLKELNYTHSKAQVLNANSANTAIQKSSQQKEKKRKRQKKEMSDEDAADELVFQEMKELNIPKKERVIKVDSMSDVKNKICDYTCHVKKKKKKQKPKKKVNEDNTLIQEDMHQMELMDRDKNKIDKFVSNLKTKSPEDNYMLIKKQITCQKIKENEILLKQLSEKKEKKENTSLLQARVLEIKSENLESNKVRLQNAELKSTFFKMQNKEDFSAVNNKILKKKIKQEIAENKEILSQNSLEKKKKEDDILPQPEVMEKSVILKSNKRAKLKLADFTESQNEETISSIDNYIATKKKERKTNNSKETWPEKSLKKKKAKENLTLEIGISTLKEQEATDSKETSSEKLLKKKKKAKKIPLLETEIATLKSDNLFSNKLQSQNYVLGLAAFFEIPDEKKDLSIVNYKDIHKKIKQKKKEENKYCAEKLSEKKKEIERTSKAKPKVPKLKSDKKIKSGKLQLHNIMLYTNKSRSSFKAQDKVLKDIHTTKCIPANEKLKKIKKRKLQDSETNKDQDKNEISVEKKKKEGKIKEKNNLSSTETLKRLPDSVIVNLADVPKKKKRKISRDEEQTTPENTGKSMTATNENSIPSNSCTNHISQFNVVSLKKIKKQSSKGTVVSAKQHVSKNREPISAYISYLQKQRATSKNKFTNEF